MMLRFQDFKKAVNIAAITHIILYRKKFLRLACLYENKCSCLLSATYSDVSILKIRVPKFPRLKPSLLPNHFDSIVEGNQLMNVALHHLTLRQCLQNSLMFDRNLLILLSCYCYLALKQRKRSGNWNVFMQMSDRT